jgi:hypothetical protein
VRLAPLDDEENGFRAVDRRRVERDRRCWAGLPNLDANLAGGVDRQVPLRVRNVDERRETVAENVSPVAMTRTLREAPGATISKSPSGTSMFMRAVVRSTTETMAVPGRTNAPGSMVRVATSPSKGHRRTQSFTSRFEPIIFARCDASCASSEAACASFISYSLGETKPPSSIVLRRADSSATARWRASMARASAETAWLEALALRQSSVANTSPRFTKAPGRTSTVST